MLGQLLTGTEAKEIADRLDDGDTLTAALRVVSAGRRAEIRDLLTDDRGSAVITAVLRAVEGARSILPTVDPVWTMPGHVAQSGPLTSSVAHLVDGARQSVTCSTFNFQRSSALWSALRRAARRPGIELRIYVDADAADQSRRPATPRTVEVAGHLHPGAVFRTRRFDREMVRNHAKFLAVDHRFLLVTSANFSWSAEHGNVEFGVVADNRNLTEAVEREMRRAEDSLYERVLPPRETSAKRS